MTKGFFLHRLLLVLFFLLLPSLVKAQVLPTVILGDMNHDGKITKDDVTLLSFVCLQKNDLQIGTVNGDAITFSTSATFSPSSTNKTFLNGDLNFDNKITISDVTRLIKYINNPASMLYVVVREGKIVFVNKQGFVFNPEEDDFVDDGEEEL